MTKDNTPPDAQPDAPLLIAKRLWHGRAWLPEGATFDTEGVPAELVQQYRQQGYLRTADEIERDRNAEAYHARKAADRQGVALQEAREKIQDLTGQLETAKAEAGKVAGLQAQVTTLTSQLQAAAGKPEDAAALKAYRDVVGELLPEGLAPNARKSLTEAGFVGKHLLARVSDEELRALPNVGDGTLEALRKFAPLHAPPAPTPEG